jgi:hypothetical protein
MTAEDGDTKKGVNNTCMFGVNKREINLMVIQETQTTLDARQRTNTNTTERTKKKSSIRVYKEINVFILFSSNPN